MDEIKQYLIDNMGMSKGIANFIVEIGIVICLIVIGIIAIKVTLSVLGKILEKSSMDPVLYRFIGNSVKAVLYVMLAITVLVRLGVNMPSLIAVIGVAGAAIALALKDSLGNVAGGIMLIINKPFSQDDFIDINGITGKVKTIDMFVTHLITYDNKVITIPNGLVNTSILINYTTETKRRVDCCFGIGYHDDIGQAKNILANIVESDSMIHQEPAPIIGVAGQQDNCIALDLKVWCETDDYWDVKYFLEENVKLAFDEAGITIPFPQMDVHIKK
ncbi:MAG: mechanosensitive ion channel [Anaerovoracaceae bacterium]